jgi:DNA primase
VPPGVLAAGLAALVHLARRHGFAVEHGDCPGMGIIRWPGRRILLPAGLSPDREIPALAHQFGHVLLHADIADLDPGGTVPCHGLRKVEADSVAYVAAACLGISPAGIGFPHVASWAGADARAHPDAVVRAATARVTGAAKVIADRIEAALPSLRGHGSVAVTAVAAAAGTPDNLPPAQPDEIAQVNQAAQEFFHARLAGSWVPGYLSGRRLDLAAEEPWHAGHVPASWDALTRGLRSAGYSDSLIQAAGLARRSRRGTLIDVFRNRVMLPIRALDGTIIAFIGRAPDPPGRGVPKYLNSPQTSLYDKSTTLFGLREARQALAVGAQPVLCEGPFDAIAVTAAGHGRFVGLAPCGTALTNQHVAELSRAVDLAAVGVLVAFDPDQAGRRAAVRAYHLLAPHTAEACTVVLPTGKDPAQILADQGTAGLHEALTGRVVPLVDLVTDAELARWNRWLDHAEGRLNALHATAAVIASMRPDHVARQVARLADQLELDCTTVTDALLAAVPSIIAKSDRAPLAGPPSATRSASRDPAGTAARDDPHRRPSVERASGEGKQPAGQRGPPAGRTARYPPRRDFPQPAPRPPSRSVASPTASNAATPPAARRSSGRRVAG